MRIDQLALLFALVLAANLVLLVALELPRLTRRGSRDTPREMGATGAGERAGARARTLTDSADFLPTDLYQRVVRVVSVVFISAALIVVSLGYPGQPGIYALLAGGALLIVMRQDVLPSGSLGRWRLAIEAGVAIAFLTLLLVLTGGQSSPFFFGYVLLLGGAAMWASGLGPPILAVVTSAAYVVGVFVSTAEPLAPAELGRVAFNLIALALVTYVASVVGREQRRAREEALRLSHFDSLTGLYSRDYLLAEVEQEILRAARTSRAFALLMVDLDGLKAANDRFGHAQGDVLLHAVSDVLRGDIRATDVAARYGGDEFVLILPETDVAGALSVAEKLRVDIARLALPYDGSVIRTSASIGLVTFPDDGRTSSELMRRADLAMYEAKRRGRDQIVRFARQVGVPMDVPPAAPREPTAPAHTQEPAVPPESPGRPPWESPIS